MLSLIMYNWLEKTLTCFGLLPRRDLSPLRTDYTIRTSITFSHDAVLCTSILILQSPSFNLLAYYYNIRLHKSTKVREGHFYETDSALALSIIEINSDYT